MSDEIKKWVPGKAPVAVVLISLNEAHNMRDVLANLEGWAQEVFLVDSFSVDDTVDIALSYGVHVVQRKFTGFGDQWNFALRELPISAPWTMKIDPDERLTDEVKREISDKCLISEFDAYTVPIRLFFLGRKLPSLLRMTRLWQTGKAQFSDVKANEHALVNGLVGALKGEISHLDSPSLDHWVVKQNRYTTDEAVSQFNCHNLAVPPNLFGDSLSRRMWLKRNFWKFPARYQILFLYHLLFLGAWRAGKAGWIWAHLRTEVYRLWEYKFYEITSTGRVPVKVPSTTGAPDPRVRVCD